VKASLDKAIAEAEARRTAYIDSLKKEREAYHEKIKQYTEQKREEEKVRQHLALRRDIYFHVGVCGCECHASPCCRETTPYVAVSTNSRLRLVCMREGSS